MTTQPAADQPFHRLGPADIGRGAFRDYQIEGHSVLVANCDGHYYAIEDRCTHDNGPLADGRLYACTIECPRHGGKFDLKSGKPTALPAFNGVASYPLRVADGQMELQFVPPPARRYDDPRNPFAIGPTL